MLTEQVIVHNLLLWHVLHSHCTEFRTEIQSQIKFSIQNLFSCWLIQTLGTIPTTAVRKKRQSRLNSCLTAVWCIIPCCKFWILTHYWILRKSGYHLFSEPVAVRSKANIQAHSKTGFQLSLVFCHRIFLGFNRGIFKQQQKNDFSFLHSEPLQALAYWLSI